MFYFEALPRSGISPYVGCLATGQRIFAEEGFKALWKGARARGFAGGIQFGTTVTIYEILKDIGVLCGVPYDIIDRPANRHIKREESDCKQCTIADNVTITHLTGKLEKNIVINGNSIIIEGYSKITFTPRKNLVFKKKKIKKCLNSASTHSTYNFIF